MEGRVKLKEGEYRNQARARNNRLTRLGWCCRSSKYDYHEGRPINHLPSALQGLVFRSHSLMDAR